MSDQAFFEEALQFASELADAAAGAILPHFRNLESIERKGSGAFDPVTEADKSAERAMRALIEVRRPSDGIIGEEYPDTQSETGWHWLLDPIDGTRAFVAGLPVWTTLISLINPEGDPVIGIIDQPVLGERYLGWPGGAALESGNKRMPLKVSDCTHLHAATIATTDPFLFGPAEQEAWTQLRSAARMTRYGLDAYAYARLAAGTIDLVAEAGLQPWDTGAIIPVMRGAGGLATDWQGRPAKPGGQIVCAATPSLLDQALKALKPAAN